MSKPDRPRLFHPAAGNRGMTEVHAAAHRGDLPALVHWLREGLNVNATDTVYGYTPVHWLADMAAAGGPRVEMLRVLAAHGADLNARTADGRTPLLLARAAGSAGGDALAAELTALGAADDETRP